MSIYILVAVGVFGVAWLLREPLRHVDVVIMKLVAGGFLISLVNFAGQSWGLHLPLNVASAALAGWLGLPGLVALAVLEHLFA